MSKSNLLSSLAKVSGVTMISRIVGFLRDVVMAQCFGVSIATDAFVLAFRLPNLLRRIFAEGAFSQAFVPVLVEYKSNRSFVETRDFIGSISGSLLIVLLIISILGTIFAEHIVLITAPGFATDLNKLELTVHLMRITFPYIMFISLASLAGSVLNSWGKFVIPAFTPIILSSTWIIFALFLSNKFNPPIIAIAWAVFMGGMLQLIFQLPFLYKLNIPILPKFNFRNNAVWRVVSLMGPAIFAMSIAQISIVINSIFASFLPNGSISWMFYADRLMEFPTGILGVALGTILLPKLSKHATNKDTLEFSRTLDWGVKLCLLFALPATIGLAILAKPLIMTLFMYGQFNIADVMMTQRALIAYDVGLLGLISVKIFAPGFYANQNVRTPVRIGIFVLICTQLLNLIFIGPFEHAGLALAIGIGACINSICLIYSLIKHEIYKPQLQGLGSYFGKLFLAVIVMSMILIVSLNVLPLDFYGVAYERAFGIILLLVIAIIVYFGCLFMCGIKIQDFVFCDRVDKIAPVTKIKINQ